MAPTLRQRAHTEFEARPAAIEVRPSCGVRCNGIGGLAQNPHPCASVRIDDIHAVETLEEQRQLFFRAVCSLVEAVEINKEAKIWVQAPGCSVGHVPANHRLQHRKLLSLRIRVLRRRPAVGHCHNRRIVAACTTVSSSLRNLLEGALQHLRARKGSLLQLLPPTDLTISHPHHEGSLEQPDWSPVGNSTRQDKLPKSGILDVAVILSLDSFL
mmetsp:Transcript_28501/g.67885  ORF Transcript_28501/g.67885 Transcript_28501/m.67885 type:complete len:213 (-) Transcript_28501:76-714(-)